MKRLAVSCLLAALAQAARAEIDLPFDLIGTWQTPLVGETSPDGSQSAWLRQTATFTDSTEALTVEAFMDADGGRPTFTYASNGSYKVVGPSAVIDGAIDLELRKDRSHVTIFVDAPELWASIGLGACDLIVGTAVDISTCASGPPFGVTDCVDLDVVQVDDGGTRLRFGALGFDRCVERPTYLSDTAFMRQP